MKSATEYLWFDTKKRREFINITDRVEDLVRRSGIAEGFVLASAMHITAGGLRQRCRGGTDGGHRGVAGTTGAL